MSIRESPVESRPIEVYRGIIPANMYREIQRLSRQLAGLSVGHLNATDGGGGVAEVLRSLVPLTKGVGLEAEWYVTEAPVSFFEITKKLHNLLQGAEGELTEEEKRQYLDQCRKFAEEMENKKIDVWFVHDPQPLAVAAFLGSHHRCCKIWRSHINTSSPNQMALNFVLPYLKEYDWQVFTLREYVPPGLAPQSVVIFLLAIDPLTEKNREMSAVEADGILARLGIDPERPLVTQVSRFDPWKDPIGVIDAYREAKREVPELQLALVGVFSAGDDPEAPRVYAEVEAHRDGDPDIHLYKDPRQVGDTEVNAFQTGSDVVMQKSIREGFGLTVAEAMWKGRPVIGGNTGGIRVQIKDGVSGFLVDNVEEAAARLIQLLKSPELRQSVGQAAKETVRRRFLMPRLLRDHLRIALKRT
ncbi:MAG: glycosyltransferase [Chloroflexota bacterium]